MVVIESTGRKLKDAIDNGLAQLNKTLMDVEVEVLDNGGLFRKAKVRITVKGEEEPEAKKEEADLKPEKVERTERPERPERAERTERSERAERGERAEKFDRAERPERGERSDSTEQKNERREQPKGEQPRQKREQPRRENRQQGEPKREQPRNEQPKSEQAKSEQQNEPVAEESRELRRNVPITDEVAEEAIRLAKEIVAKMGIETEVTSSVVAGGLVIEFGSHSSELIGYHGEVLDAIEYIISCAINKDDDKFYRVVVDCDNYRAKRKESLVALANKMAAKCLKIRHKVVLEPMNSNERRIIHATLATNDKIITKSEGHEPNRRVVIFCKKR